MKDNSSINKTALANKLGVSRSSLYYESRTDHKDEILKDQILYVMSTHPAYGHRRIAMELGINKKRVLRVMKKFRLEPEKQRSSKPKKKNDIGNEPAKYENWLDKICPIRPNVFWASDFTYIKFRDRFLYLATIIDVFTREIVGFALSIYHNVDLIKEAFEDAVSKRPYPYFAHSDQGSEYMSDGYINLLKSLGITISVSPKSSPWKNAFQESFYSQFKLELGPTKHFGDIGELVEAIYLQINYYNYRRIHTTLKMPPAVYARKHLCNDATCIKNGVLATLLRFRQARYAA